MKKRYNMIAIKLMLVTGCCMMVYGCSQKWYDARNINRMQSYMPRYQPQASALANQLWPCFKGPLHSDTITTFGPPNLVYQIGDSVIVKSHDTVRITRYDTLKFTKTQTKTVHDTVVNDRQNAVLLSQFKSKADSLVKISTQLADKTKNCRTWMWIAVGCMVFILVCAAIWVYKTFFTGGGVVKAATKLL